MEFKLRIEADRPTNGDLVLAAETPLSGLQFVQEVGKCLRRSIDHVAKARHYTLGALVTYEMAVPQQMAIESGKFNDSDTYTLIVEHGLLSNFIFYCATIHTGPAGRRCYPFTNNEATLSSQIDELAFLNAWAEAGYPSRLMMSGGCIVNGENFSGNNNSSGNTGGIGCSGCTCGKDDRPSRPPCPPPPKPPIIGNPSDRPKPPIAL